MLEGAFPHIRVQGEITGFKRAASGHLYFRLKDDDAVLDGVCWRGTAGRLAIDPEDGMEVIATGRITSYAGRSNYQIIVDSFELAGEGALLKLLEERRKKLTAEGLFDMDRKSDLPFIPDVIGVVSSPTGAVIRDILHRLEDRFPSRVLLWPVAVQGEPAAGEITAAINGFNELKTGGPVPMPDLLIVARGGGSLEDLMAFNEESVVRAAAASDIPLISAVGHETDTTLIDYAADVRAPTPTAAAEMAVPVRADLLAGVQDNGARLTGAISRLVESGRRDIDATARGLPDLSRLVGEFTQRLDDWTERLSNAMRVGLEGRRTQVARLVAEIPKPHRQLDHAKDQLKSEVRALRAAGRSIVTERRGDLKQASALLESFSYQRVLERGFALVTGDGDSPIDSVKKLSPGMPVSMRFQDGQTGATVNGAAPTGKTRKKKQKDGGDDPQGTLL